MGPEYAPYFFLQLIRCRFFRFVGGRRLKVGYVEHLTVLFEAFPESVVVGVLLQQFVNKIFDG